MRKNALLIFALVITVLFSFSITSYAEEKVFKLATASEQGVYHTVVGREIANQAKHALKIQLIPTRGSKDNLERLKKKEIDGALVQLDALITESSDLDLVVVAELHKEFVHFLVRQDSKIRSIKDLTPQSKIAIGPIGGGSRLTWQSFCKTDNSYKNVATVPLTGSRALAALETGEIDGYIYTSGLGSNLIKQAEKQPEKFELTNIDDWDFNNAKFKSKRVYEFLKINKDVYPGLIEGAFNRSVETLYTYCVLVVSREWADENNAEFDALYAATSSALPNILIKVKQK